MDKFTHLRGLIKESLNASPESWRSFFLRHNCDPNSSAPEQEIVRAYRNDGTNVVTEVNDILANDYNFASLNGFSISVSKEKIADYLRTGADVVDALKKTDNTSETSDTDSASIEKKESEEDEQAKAVKRKKTLWIAFGVVVVVCVVGIIIIYKHSKK